MTDSSDTEIVATRARSRELLLLCLRARLDPSCADELARAAGNTSLDWDDALALAAAERVSPLVYHSLRHLGEKIPPHSLEELGNCYRQSAARNLLVFLEAREALRQLQAEHLPTIVLKGGALAESIYENIALRPMGDIDLLVAAEHLSAVCRVLGRLGFEPLANTEARPGAVAEYESQHLLVKQGPVPFALEVHWSLFDSPYYQEKMRMDWFWQTAEPARISTAPALVLGTEALLIHLCGHLCLHHGGDNLLWLHDVAEVIHRRRQRIDWSQLLLQTRELELVLSVRQILRRVIDDWRSPVPPEVVHQLEALTPSPEEVRVFRWLTAADRPPAQRFWVDVASMSGWRQRLRFARVNLFPSASYMQRRYEIRHRLLVPLYYPYRWMRGLRGT